MTGGSGPMMVEFGNMRVSHHASHSGYQLLETWVGRRIRTSRLGSEFSVPASTAVRIARRAFRLGGREWYDEGAMALEWQVARRLRSRSVGLIHLLWGESQYRWAAVGGRAANRRLVVTFHQPPSVFRRVGPSERQLHRLDGVIALSANQRAFYEEILGADRVFQVEHGVDTGFFSPGVEKRDDATCLVVGQWLRDTSVLASTARVLAEREPEIRFALVGNQNPDPALSGLRNVEVLPRLSDEELLERYRRASLLFLPLQDSTANCGLLEGIASGTPIVCSDVGGVRSYVDDSMAALAEPGDPESHAQAILDVLGSVDGRESMSLAATLRARDFDWAKIADRMVKTYEALL